MLEKLNTALVKSFVGAITVAWILAQAVFHFASTLSTPIAKWLMWREYGVFAGHNPQPRGISALDALPELLEGCALLLAGYVLLRWLYFKPAEEATTEQALDL